MCVYVRLSGQVFLDVCMYGLSASGCLCMPVLGVVWQIQYVCIISLCVMVRGRKLGGSKSTEEIHCRCNSRGTL